MPAPAAPRGSLSFGKTDHLWCAGRSSGHVVKASRQAQSDGMDLRWRIGSMLLCSDTWEGDTNLLERSQYIVWGLQISSLIPMEPSPWTPSSRIAQGCVPGWEGGPTSSPASCGSNSRQFACKNFFQNWCGPLCCFDPFLHTFFDMRTSIQPEWQKHLHYHYEPVVPCLWCGWKISLLIDLRSGCRHLSQLVRLLYIILLLFSCTYPWWDEMHMWLKVYRRGQLRLESPGI